MRICFVGLGTMGLPMALRLTESGFALAAWDVLANAGTELEGRRGELEQQLPPTPTSC